MDPVLCGQRRYLNALVRQMNKDQLDKFIEKHKYISEFLAYGALDEMEIKILMAMKVLDE